LEIESTVDPRLIGEGLESNQLESSKAPESNRHILTCDNGTSTQSFGGLVAFWSLQIDPPVTRGSGPSVSLYVSLVHDAEAHTAAPGKYQTCFPHHPRSLHPSTEPGLFSFGEGL
jgi:hypothetical protein